MMRFPSCMSMLTLSLDKPGSSNVAVMRFLSGSSCRSILSQAPVNVEMGKRRSQALDDYLGFNMKVPCGSSYEARGVRT